MKKEVINLRDAEKYLNEVLKKLRADQEYNILAHQISSYYINYKTDTLYEEEINSMLKRGLYISKYSSMFGTLSLLGEINSNTVNKILNYSYYSNTPKKAILIVAMPKYVNINGKKIEFSSYKGLSAKDKAEPIVAEYKKVGFVPEMHHFKSCLFDAIKGYSEMPTYFNVGAIIIDEKNNTCTIYDAQTHLSCFNQESRQKLNEAIENKVNEMFSNLNAKSIEEAMAKAYMKEHAWREEELLFNYS